IMKIKERISNINIIAFSNQNPEDINEIRKIIIPDKTYCLLGSSGVGKTTLLNKLSGNNLFCTQAVRKKDKKGRHTTSVRHLIRLETGAFIIDNPGIRELGNIDVNTGLNSIFDKINLLSKDCKFKNCTHQHEKKCAVLQAVDNKQLSEKGYQNYMKLKKESDYNKMNSLEKRRKDKALGKFYKKTLKEINKTGKTQDIR
ncbi:MAG: ribosome small subunit-dependent GTPase A, partial [bacterium]|nr:ribosome small subunit-dependent GTPase A [bacterium]